MPVRPVVAHHPAQGNGAKRCIGTARNHHIREESAEGGYALDEFNPLHVGTQETQTVDDMTFLQALRGEGHRMRKKNCRPGTVDELATWNVECISIDDPENLRSSR